MPFPMSPPPVAACDTAAAEAVVSRLEDQAFAAMKAATEKVALAARSGAVGAAGDAEWAEYKRLRMEADRSRADAIACRVRPVVAAAPSPAASPLAEARPPTTSVAAASAYADPGAPRFRVEASVFEADRQPTSASRVRIAASTGYAYSATPVPPTPLTFSGPGVFSTFDGPQQKVRSWASGFTLAGEFAPAGLDADGWRFTSRIGNQLERTKIEAAPFTDGYFISGPTELVTLCGGCAATYRTPVTSSSVYYRTGFLVSPHSDNIKQTSKKLDLDFGAVRDFSLAEAFGGLRASLGGELGVGWWMIDERELVVADNHGNLDSFRSSDGPVGRAALTAALSAPVPRIESVTWSVRSRIGYEIADLTTTSLSYSYGTGKEATVHDMSDGVIGSLGARLDYVNGPFGGFLAVERRRDFSLNSVLTSQSVLGRVSKPFTDGSAVYVWPVYSSRLTVGVNYGF